MRWIGNSGWCQGFFSSRGRRIKPNYTLSKARTLLTIRCKPSVVPLHPSSPTQPHSFGTSCHVPNINQQQTGEENVGLASNMNSLNYNDHSAYLSDSQLSRIYSRSLSPNSISSLVVYPRWSRSGFFIATKCRILQGRPPRATAPSSLHIISARAVAYIHRVRWICSPSLGSPHMA